MNSNSGIPLCENWKLGGNLGSLVAKTRIEHEKQCKNRLDEIETRSWHANSDLEVGSLHKQVRSGSGNFVECVQDVSKVASSIRDCSPQGIRQDLVK
jgi:hypothetical protein